MTMEPPQGLPPSTPDTADLGAKLRAAREAAGHSLAGMAALTHFSKPYLGLVETGRRPATPDVVERYEHALGVPIGTPSDPVRLTHEWLIGDPPVPRQLRAGRRIGTGLIETLESRVIELRHLDDTVGSRMLLPVIRTELDQAEHLARTASYTDAAGKRLYTVIGELAQLAGWVASDAGRYPDAQRLYLSGVTAAESAGDRALGAQLLSSLAYQITNVGKREDALLIARSAVTGVPDASPLVRALLLERLAWAAARLRDTDTTRRALDAVNDVYDQRSDGLVEPEWVYWLNRTEIDVMAARCLIELGQPATAEPLLTRALAGYNHDHAREVALYQTWLAEGHARAGNLDAAREVLHRIDATAIDTGSARLHRRITAVDRLIDRHAQKRHATSTRRSTE
ncbi:helix-turn-helix domain-containing protein [Micromonospora inyonensis]|uniref:Helix-turn-helix domain-containing protein n=1 Tax=Micromonospora inyonensis TaxID=47866 RepID=A0A1C6S5C8_9ACTN|nr:helix-turn-helix transcriptional regulator [Micromonospora inyonensis]SCL24474.1 Helix-turn-helix domain-containing protein [Micromonospora inyonensis]